MNLLRPASTIALLCLITYSLSCQGINNPRAYPRYSFYSTEKHGEILISLPPSLISGSLAVKLVAGDNIITEIGNLSCQPVVRIPFDTDKLPSSGRIDAEIKFLQNGSQFTIPVTINLLKYKPNEVKVDRLTGGLIVNKLPFFPFGFYCYSPVPATLPEEEVVKGFNVISPYQKIMPETLKERKTYMDRCSRLGMKVHYNLLSVSGGGGVNSKIDGLSGSEKKERLVNEIKTFMDHPALLAWYIADEPNGNGLAPDSLLSIYNLVRETDPWHPVSVVFTPPFLSSLKYADALDIVMADPYPVPELPVSFVGNITSQLTRAFYGSKPVWVVPQAFGGGEIWKREPTIQELRSMTYQAIINGAKGIQYFIRQGLNIFPKSTALWGECGKMAMEVGELTPWLLSEEKSPKVTVTNPDITARSFSYRGKLLILAVNKKNAPSGTGFSVPALPRDKVRVLFENREISFSGGTFSDILSPFGSQAYILDLEARHDSLEEWKGNLVIDPGFEDLSSPGVPSACYARGNGERGGTYFTDTRECAEGYHSVRFVTPAENGSVKLRFFPFRIRPGASYMISVIAKCDNSQGSGLYGKSYFDIGIGEYGKERFTMSDEWKQFVTFVTIPSYGDVPDVANLLLQMPSPGVGWFDMVQVAECNDFDRCVNPEIALFFPWN